MRNVYVIVFIRNNSQFIPSWSLDYMSCWFLFVFVFFVSIELSLCRSGDCVDTTEMIRICFFFSFFARTEIIYPKVGDDQTTVSSIGPGEVPPPYQQLPHGGVPMVTCRVCQAMIDISNKREQHVVKCHQCQEATVKHHHPPHKRIPLTHST